MGYFNLDRTFCASPNCKGECHRALTPELQELAEKLNKPLSFAYFCGVHHNTEEVIAR